MKRLINPWLREPGYFCFGCAPENKAGVRMKFYSDGDDVVSIWHPEQQFQGWIDTLHGGIQSVLLDEICAWVVMVKYNITGVTSKMETRFMKPISTKEPYLVIRASEVEKRRNLVTINAVIMNPAGEICSKAQCLYFTFPSDKEMADSVPEIGEEITLDEVIAANE
ncbi:MAG: PaaI family thioesterase [Bacteroidales bacterium]